MDNVIVVAGAALLIGFILWWSFGQHNTEIVAADVQDDQQTVVIKVDGGYVPNSVKLKQGVPATLIFDRKDPSACLEEVVFPDFGIHEKLPVDALHSIPIDTSKSGEFKYACGMNMFFGKVIIE